MTATFSLGGDLAHSLDDDDCGKGESQNKVRTDFLASPSVSDKHSMLVAFAMAGVIRTFGTSKVLP